MPIVQSAWRAAMCPCRVSARTLHNRRFAALVHGAYAFGETIEGRGVIALLAGGAALVCLVEALWRGEG